jgi:hypothetical protein
MVLMFIIFMNNRNLYLYNIYLVSYKEDIIIIIILKMD